jgi:hypothetical protein
MFKTFKGYFKGKKSLRFSKDGKPLDRHNFENAMDAALDDTVSPRQRAQRLEDVHVYTSQPVFKYAKQVDLAWSRDIMIELWRSIMSMMNMQGERLPNEARQACNKCILGIIKRKEFRLEIMGFNPDEITIDKNDEPVWRRYYSLLRNTFVYCVRRINQVESMACNIGSDRSVTRGLPYSQDYVGGELAFCSEILAISYFRIPGVTLHVVQRVRAVLMLKRPQLLLPDDSNPKSRRKQGRSSKSIIKGMRVFTSPHSKRATSLMRTITKQAEERVEDTRFAEMNPSLFFWQFVGTDSSGDDDEIEMCFVDGKNAWLDKLQWSGYFYAAFMHSWVSHVRGTVESDGAIRFGTLPGFPILLKLYICLLEERYFYEYDSATTRSKVVVGSPALTIEDGLGLVDDTVTVHRFVADTPRAMNMVMKVSKDMLTVCPYLFNIFVPLAIENTSIHYSKCVEVCMNDINEYLKVLKNAGARVNVIEKSLVPRALVLLSTHEHHRQLLCAFRFIYSNEMMLAEMKIDIRGEVFEDCLLRPQTFFKFFLHWEYTVRVTFFHLLVFRLFVLPRQALKLASDKAIVAPHVFQAAQNRTKQLLKPSRHPSFGTDQRLAALLEGNLASVHHDRLGKPGPSAIPKDKAVYAAKAFAGYSRIVEEYYRRSLASLDGIVNGPAQVNVEIETPPPPSKVRKGKLKHYGTSEF